MFFFSSRRRHTVCALVTGVQTCALPIFFHLRKPDDLPAQALYTDPSVPMYLLLKSGFIRRTVGSDNVMATSLGKPLLDSVHVDAWGRRWQAREWALPYAN